MNALPKLSARRFRSGRVWSRFRGLEGSLPLLVVPRRCWSAFEFRSWSHQDKNTCHQKQKIVSALEASLPHVAISTNPYDLDRHGRGESHHPAAPPSAVVSPTCVDDVVAIVKLCDFHDTPMIPYGVGTSLEGHVCAIHGGISIDMSLLDEIIMEENTAGLPDPIVSVGAGVTRKRLNEALRHTGMQFVLDPGADATIGGMVATGASGTTAARYGTMRENILGLECVLANGTVAQCGTKAFKSSAGYDLKSLMTGSEGTLGIITRVTVKLHPIPEHVVAAICVFGDLFSAAEAVAALKLSAIPLSRCELLDAVSVAAFNQYIESKNNGESLEQSGGGKNPERMEEKPTLFLEFEGPSEVAVQEVVKMTQSICTDDFGGSNFQYTSGEAERKSLWSARHNLYYASIALKKGATASDTIVTDACVPLSKFAELISATAKDVKELRVVGPCFGHAGDGNFHCILPLSKDDPQDYIDRLHQVNHNLIQRTLAVGGTCTGEHGVGYGKMAYLEQQSGAGAMQMMRMIKASLDPRGLMNPGKIVSYDPPNH